MRRIVLISAMLFGVATVASAQTGPFYQACSTKNWPGLTFGANVPSYSLGADYNGNCYCGVWTGITPQQAMKAGWYASCNNGKGICNYAPGTWASNQVCGPFNAKPKQH